MIGNVTITPFEKVWLSRVTSGVPEFLRPAIVTYLLVVRLLKGCMRSCSELQISVGEADYPVDAT